MLICGYGIGLSLGVIEANIEKYDILPIVITNEYYEDGGLNLV